jgi:hypothetical protein
MSTSNFKVGDIVDTTEDTIQKFCGVGPYVIKDISYDEDGELLDLTGDGWTWYSRFFNRVISKKEREESSSFWDSVAE